MKARIKTMEAIRNLPSVKSFGSGNIWFLYSNSSSQTQSISGQTRDIEHSETACEGKQYATDGWNLFDDTIEEWL